jgi:hypothetical protein
MSTTSTPTPATTPSLPPITWLRLPAALLTRHTLASPPLRISLFSTTTMLRIGSLPGSGRKIKGSSRPEVRLVRRYPFLLRELARRGGRGGKYFPLQLLCSSSAAPLQLLHLGLSDLAFPSTPLTSVGHKKLSCASAFLRREDATLSGPQADCPLSFYLHTVVEKLYQMLGDPSMHAASLSLTSLRLHESPRYERD